MAADPKATARHLLTALREECERIGAPSAAAHDTVQGALAHVSAALEAMEVGPSAANPGRVVVLRRGLPVPVELEEATQP